MEHLLFEPVRIGPITVPNRIVMPAMHLNYTMGGEITDQFIDFYRARAEGGVGLIIIGGCAIDTVGGFFFLVGMHEDRFVPGLRRFVERCTEGLEVKLCAQLYQAGRYAFSAFTREQPIAPSPLGSAYNKETPREMTKEDIARVQQSFVEAARRAAEAGFHAVEILGSAGYLVSQFLSPASNRRTDEYGGSLENRARFGVEIIERVKAEVGDRLAVLIRVAGNDFVPGGHTNQDSAQAARLFEAAGVDGINVTGGWHESRVPQITMGVPEGAYSYLAAGIRRAVKIPVIASNRLGDPRLAGQILANGHADLVAMGRPLIADPQLPSKVRNAQPETVRPCIACNQGCFDHVFQGTPAECMLNPQAGHEKKRAIVPTESPRKIVVVGAGPGGAEAARVAALRGHDVVLMEREVVIGGALWFAGAAPGRHDFLRYVDYLSGALEDAGVDVRLGVEANVDTILAEGPDHVIVATGAEPIIPGFADDSTHPNIVLAEDVLSGQVVLEGDVVIVGGGSVGAETALDIAERDAVSPEVAAFLIINEAESLETVRDLLVKPQRRVHVCELLTKIAKDMGKTTRWTVIQDLERRGIELHRKTEVLAIEEQGVRIREGGEEQLLECGTVVIAVGYRPRKELAEALAEARIPATSIGDAVSPRRVEEAVREGFLTALKL